MAVRIDRLRDHLPLFPSDKYYSFEVAVSGQWLAQFRSQSFRIGRVSGHRSDRLFRGQQWFFTALKPRLMLIEMMRNRFSSPTHLYRVGKSADVPAHLRPCGVSQAVDI